MRNRAVRVFTILTHGARPLSRPEAVLKGISSRIVQRFAMKPGLKSDVPYFLAKTEPLVYSIDRLRSEVETIWDGVRNPQAVQAIRSMQPQDRVFIYHSGGVSAIVGLADVVSAPEPDPSDARSVVVRLRYAAHLTPPTTLADVKASGLFNDWSLVRQSRLSTMKAPDAFVAWMRRRYPDVTI